MPRKYLLKLFISTAIFLSATIHVYAQAAKAEAEIQQIMERRHAIGLSVVVVKDNNILYTHSFGKKNTEQDISLSDTDLFRIASISKSFSATSIMQLVEAGKFKLNDDFSKLVGFQIRNPKYPGTAITLQMVLSHRSSLNDSQGYFSLDVIDPSKNPDWAKCYNDYEPGKGYEYCNLNFNLVGAVIEKHSAERFDQYVKHHILDPLVLYGGYCVDSLDANRFATLYEYDSVSHTYTVSAMAYAPRRAEIKNYVMGYSTPVFSPTGGMKISASDLARYMMMHMNYGTYNGIKIMSKKHAKAMQKKVSEVEGYGMAMMNYDDLIPGKHMTGHTGSAYGLYSAMFFQPEEKFGFVVITNGSDDVENGGIKDILKSTIRTLYSSFVK